MTELVIGGCRRNMSAIHVLVMQIDGAPQSVLALGSNRSAQKSLIAKT